MIPDLSVPSPFRFLALLLLGGVLSCGPSEPGESGEDRPVDSLFLDISLEEALMLSAAKGLPVFVTVQSPLRDRSGPALDREYWADPIMADLLRDRTIPLRIIADDSPDFVAKHKVWFFPTFLLFDANGEVETRIQGMRDVESLYFELRDLLGEPEPPKQIQTN